MKIVHFANWAPRKSGMYESTKEQIKYERREGFTSDFVDVYNEKTKNEKDDWLMAVPWSVAEDADIWVMHSKIPEPLKKLFEKKITIAVLHGPSEHLLLMEWVTNRKATTFNMHTALLWQYDATVVLNKHEYNIMKLYDEYGKLYYIPNSIDLENYTPDGHKWNYLHHPAIISCDVPRLEKLPAHIIWSMPNIQSSLPNARLNVYSLTLEPIATWRNMFCRSKNRKLEHLSENIQLECNDLRPFMRGADIGFNNNISGILSRVSMEMMAMGVPIVSYGGDQNGILYTKFIAKIYDLDSIAQKVVQCWRELSKPKSTLRKETIQFAKEHFSRAKEIKKYTKLYEALSKKKYGKIV